jgi:dihydroorotate dehydrogenase (fumarate)
VRADFALTGGVHTAQDALKAMMAGAKVTMLASALVRHGPHYLTQLLADIETWMVEQEYHSITQMQGSMSQRAVSDPAAFERANYMKALTLFDQQV